MKKKLLFLAVSFLACLASCNDDDTPTLAELKFDKPTEELVLGETKTYVFTYSPEVVDKPEVVWTSSNDEVADVDAHGLVTALTVGETTITIAKEDFTASFQLIVKPIKVAEITFVTESTEIKIGDIIDLEANVLPDDASDKTLTWSSSDATVATVVDGIVTGIAVGTAVITAENGGVSAVHTINVLHNEVESITITGLTVAATAGSTHQLVFEVLPLDAIDKTLVWKSASEAVATVDQNGLVTAVAVGNSEITATAVNGIVGTVQFGVSPIAPPPPPPPF